MADIKSFTPGNTADKKKIWKEMVSEAKRFKEPDESLQAKTVLIMTYDVKANSFTATASAMVRFLKLYPSYREPAKKETQREAALKVAELLCSSHNE